MKRIYLVGAALILLLICAVSYYNIKNNPAPNEQDMFTSANAQPSVTQPSVTPVPEPLVDNAPEPAFVDNPIVTPITQTPRSHHRTDRTRRVKWQPQVTVIDAIPVSGEEVAVNAPEVQVETSREYFGNTPVVTTYKPSQVSRRIVTRHAAKQRHFSLTGRTLQFGPEIGFNQNGLYRSNTSSMMTGNFHAGLLFNVRLGDHLAIQPGLRYIAKGAKTLSTEDVSTKEKITLRYLELPANLVVKLGSVSNARITLGAGPYVAYLLDAKDKFSNSRDGNVSDAVNPPQPVYRTENINNFDWGLGGFVGVESPEGLFLKAGAQYGMQNILRNPATGISSDRNYNFLFSVGYMIGGFDRK